MKYIAFLIVLLAGAALTGCGGHASSGAYANGVAAVSTAQVSVEQARLNCASDDSTHPNCAALLSDGRN